ncbi:MAG: hypothetical protein COA78_32845 [Blastopirellula sp.]|nr:MAG: hypothetical protein COA78_32845 [Blastopirellula sp.]
MARLSAQQRRINALLRKYEPIIRKAFAEAMKKAANAVDKSVLLAALEAGDFERAILLVRIERGVLFPLDEALRNVFNAGGYLAVADLPTGISGVFGFNGAHPRAVEIARSQAASLVTYIMEDATQSARKIIIVGLSENRSVAKVARDLIGRKIGRSRVGGVIGLTGPQTDSIIRGRSDLLSGDPKRMRRYLTLKQRDKRFDSSIKRAIAEGKPIRGARLDMIMEGHRNKALAYRGKTVAKSEAFTAQATGRDEGYRQILDSGKVESVSVRWQHNLSVKPRADHVAMSGTVIQLGETFDFGGVRMRFPHDFAGGAEHSVGCRCTAFYRIRVPRG